MSLIDKEVKKTMSKSRKYQMRENEHSIVKDVWVHFSSFFKHNEIVIIISRVPRVYCMVNDNLKK